MVKGVHYCYNAGMSAIFIYFRKNWFPVTAAISAVLILTITIQILKEEACPVYMPWYQCIANHIFKYFSNWGIVLSATVTLLLAIAAFGTIAENRRIRLEDMELASNRRSLDEIRIWAEEAYADLINPGLEDLQTEQKKMIQKLAPIAARSLIVRECAEWLGGDLVERINDALKSMQSFIDVLNEDVNKIIAFGDEWPTKAYNDSKEQFRESLGTVIHVASIQRVLLDSETIGKDLYRGFKE